MSFKTEKLRFVVKVKTGEISFGTGVLLSSRIVITCAHVIWPEWELTEGWSDEDRENAFQSFLKELIENKRGVVVGEAEGNHVHVFLDGADAPILHPNKDLVILILKDEIDNAFGPACFLTGFDEEQVKLLELQRLDVYGFGEGGNTPTPYGAGESPNLKPSWLEDEKVGLRDFVLAAPAGRGNSGGPVVIEGTKEPVCIGLATIGPASNGIGSPGAIVEDLMGAIGSDQIYQFVESQNLKSYGPFKWYSLKTRASKRIQNELRSLSKRNSRNHNSKLEVSRPTRFVDLAVSDWKEYLLATILSLVALLAAKFVGFAVFSSTVWFKTLGMSFIFLPSFLVLVTTTIPKYLESRRLFRLAKIGRIQHTKTYFSLKLWEADDRDSFRLDGQDVEALEWVKEKISSSEPFLFVDGFSGTGKSSLFHNFVSRQLPEEIKVVWINTRVVHNPLQTITNVLQKFQPTISQSSTDAVDLIQKFKFWTGPRVVIYVDQGEELLLDNSNQLTLLCRQHRKERFRNLTVIVGTRTEYLVKFKRQGLYETRDPKFTVGSFDEAVAQEFMKRGLDDELDAVQLTSLGNEIEGNIGVIRPIVLNLLGAIYRRDIGLRKALDEATKNKLHTFQRFIAERICAKDMRELGPAIIGSLLSQSGMRKRPQSAPAICQRLEGEHAAVESSLRLLEQDGFVRQVGDCWEISHEFFASHMSAVISSINSSWMRKLKSIALPVALVLWLGLFSAFLYQTYYISTLTSALRVEEALRSEGYDKLIRIQELTDAEKTEATKKLVVESQFFHDWESELESKQVCLAIFGFAEDHKLRSQIFEEVIVPVLLDRESAESVLQANKRLLQFLSLPPPKNFWKSKVEPALKGSDDQYVLQLIDSFAAFRLSSDQMVLAASSLTKRLNDKFSKEMADTLKAYTATIGESGVPADEPINLLVALLRKSETNEEFLCYAQSLGNLMDNATFDNILAEEMEKRLSSIPLDSLAGVYPTNPGPNTLDAIGRAVCARLQSPEIPNSDFVWALEGIPHGTGWEERHRELVFERLKTAKGEDRFELFNRLSGHDFDGPAGEFIREEYLNKMDDIEDHFAKVAIFLNLLEHLNGDLSFVEPNKNVVLDAEIRYFVQQTIFEGDFYGLAVFGDSIVKLSPYCSPSVRTEILKQLLELLRVKDNLLRLNQVIVPAISGLSYFVEEDKDLIVQILAALSDKLAVTHNSDTADNVIEAMEQICARHNLDLNIDDTRKFVKLASNSDSKFRRQYFQAAALGFLQFDANERIEFVTLLVEENAFLHLNSRVRNIGEADQFSANFCSFIRSTNDENAIKRLIEFQLKVLEARPDVFDNWPEQRSTVLEKLNGESRDKYEERLIDSALLAFDSSTSTILDFFREFDATQHSKVRRRLVAKLAEELRNGVGLDLYGFVTDKVGEFDGHEINDMYGRLYKHLREFPSDQSHYFEVRTWIALESEMPLTWEEKLRNRLTIARRFKFAFELELVNGLVDEEVVGDRPVADVILEYARANSIKIPSGTTKN